MFVDAPWSVTLGGWFGAVEPERGLPRKRQRGPVQGLRRSWLAGSPSAQGGAGLVGGESGTVVTIPELLPRPALALLKCLNGNDRPTLPPTDTALCRDREGSRAP